MHILIHVILSLSLFCCYSKLHSLSNSLSHSYIQPRQFGSRAFFLKRMLYYIPRRQPGLREGSQEKHDTQLLPTQFLKTSPCSPEKLYRGLWGILFSSWLQSKAGFSQSEGRGSGGPPGSRSSHQGLISGSGYLKVWLCAGENNPHWVLGCLRAAQPV